MKSIDVRVLFVDTKRNCFDATTLDGISTFSDIRYVNSGVMRSGMTYDLEIGDIVKIELLDNGLAQFVGFYSPFRKDAQDQISYQSGQPLQSPETPDRLPGDLNWHGPDGQILSLLRGKVARVGGGPLAQTFYFGLEGLIRNLCHNYESFGSGFRVFSVNTDGKVVTRLCFSSSDQFVAKGVNENEDAVSESFEYQIDIDENGITLFVGTIDPKTGKRVNNFTTTINRDGDLVGTCGKFMQFAMYATGAMTQKIFDEDHKIVYNKSIALGGDGVLVKEIVEGNYIRQINGDYYENVSGTKNCTSDKDISTNNVKDHSSNLNRKSAGMNITDLSSAPVVLPKQR